MYRISSRNMRNHRMENTIATAIEIGNLTYKSTYANLRKGISSANTRRTYLMLTLFTMLLFIFLQVLMFDAYPDMVIGLQPSKDPPNI
ncbi:hypothetical protein Goari_010345 [Gossypium aridum]|uniref:Uncharacterized protein n=1 Tax=Gossypium aridum TaxID=34290 RepID=A0A7J8XZR2_GOSAI|nr:hypothetical protein [Gossypium aridum]